MYREQPTACAVCIITSTRDEMSSNFSASFKLPSSGVTFSNWANSRAFSLSRTSAVISKTCGCDASALSASSRLRTEPPM